jgi:predicted permease
MIIGSVLTQIALVGYLTASPIATLIMLAASLMTAVFAVSLALWFSRIFQKNLLRGGRSKTNTILRLFFILMWGLLLVGVGSLLTVPWYGMPLFEKTLFDLSSPLNPILCLLYPISASMTIAYIAHSNVIFPATLLAPIALLGYSGLAMIAGKWSFTTVRHISQGAGVKIARVMAGDFSIKTRSPIMGYITKDLRTASRNPATAFFFALPTLQTIISALLVSNFQALRASAVLTAALMGGLFALLLPLALLNAEGTGIEYTKTLPISPRRIVTSKALISTATFAPAPLILVILALTKTLTFWGIILIPFLVLISIAAASVFEIKLFLSTVAEGKIATLLNDLKKLVIGAFTVLLPIALYVTTYLAFFNHAFSLSAMGLTSIAELAIALHSLEKQ